MVFCRCSTCDRCARTFEVSQWAKTYDVRQSTGAAEVAFGDRSNFHATEIPRPLFWKPFGMFANDNSGSYDMSTWDAPNKAGSNEVSSYMVEPNVIVKHVETVIQ